MRNLMAFLLAVGCLAPALAGCSSAVRGNVGNIPVYKSPLQEAEWIRNGDPIEFEGQLWYPQDEVDILVDSEVTLVAEYRGVQVFIERVDVRPYRVLYTKFSEHKFRNYRLGRGLND